MSVLKTHAVKQIKMHSYKTFKHHHEKGVKIIFFLDCEMILIVYLALWFTTLLCGTSHRVESNEVNPWLVWKSSQCVLVLVIVLNSGMWFFFFVNVRFYSYCNIPLVYNAIQSCILFKISFHPWIWNGTAILEPNEGNGCFLMLTWGISSWPASGRPYIVTSQMERWCGEIARVFNFFFSLCPSQCLR